MPWTRPTSTIFREPAPVCSLAPPVTSAALTAAALCSEPPSSNGDTLRATGEDVHAAFKGYTYNRPPTLAAGRAGRKAAPSRPTMGANFFTPPSE